MTSRTVITPFGDSTVSVRGVNGDGGIEMTGVQEVKVNSSVQRRESALSKIYNDQKKISKWNAFFGFRYTVHGAIKVSRLMHPNSPMLKAWNIFQFCFLMYVAFGAPLRIAFEDEIVCSEVAEIIDLCCDTYFLLDIVLSFCTARLTATEYDDNFRSVAFKYIRSGEFLFDLVVSFPVSWYIYISYGFCADSNGNNLLVLRLPRMLRMARLLKVVRFMKVLKLPFFSRINPFIIRMWKLGIGMLFILHFTSCIYWYIKKTDPNLDEWEIVHSVYELPVASKYLASLYYIVATFTTVGYGDISGENDQERVFAIFAMLFGAVFFAIVVSNVSSLVANSNAAENQRQSKIQYVKKFVKFWRFDPALSSRLLDYYYHFHNNHQYLLGESLLKEIPAVLRNELCLIMAKDTLAKISIFQDVPEEYLSQIFLSLTAIRASPGEMLIKAGTPGDEMYILVKGEVVVIDSQGSQLANLSDGDIFGEVALIRAETRIASVVATTFCDLYLLKKEDLDNANMRFPEIKQRFKKLARKRYELTVMGAGVDSLDIGDLTKSDNLSSNNSNRLDTSSIPGTVQLDTIQEVSRRSSPVPLVSTLGFPNISINDDDDVKEGEKYVNELSRILNCVPKRLDRDQLAEAQHYVGCILQTLSRSNKAQSPGTARYGRRSSVIANSSDAKRSQR